MLAIFKESLFLGLNMNGTIQTYYDFFNNILFGSIKIKINSKYFTTINYPSLQILNSLSSISIDIHLKKKIQILHAYVFVRRKVVPLYIQQLPIFRHMILILYKLHQNFLVLFKKFSYLFSINQMYEDFCPLYQETNSSIDAIEIDADIPLYLINKN